MKSIKSRIHYYSRMLGKGGRWGLSPYFVVLNLAVTKRRHKKWKKIIVVYFQYSLHITNIICIWACECWWDQFFYGAPGLHVRASPHTWSQENLSILENIFFKCIGNRKLCLMATLLIWHINGSNWWIPRHSVIPLFSLVGVLQNSHVVLKQQVNLQANCFLVVHNRDDQWPGKHQLTQENRVTADCLSHRCSSY